MSPLVGVIFGFIVAGVLLDRWRLYRARHPAGELPISKDPVQRIQIEAMKDPRQYRDLGPNRFCRCIGCPNPTWQEGLCRMCTQEKVDWRGAL